MKDITLKSVYIDQANHNELLESTLRKSCSQNFYGCSSVHIGKALRGSHHGFQGKTAQFLLWLEKKMFGRVTGSLKMMA